MGRKRNDKSTNITVNFDEVSYNWLKDKTKTEWGTLPLGQVIQCAIKKLIALERD